MSIEVVNVSKTFDNFKALSGVSLTVSTGELVALLGPSGSGKTTLLRIIAGLEVPDPGSGPILYHSEDVARRGVGERGVGFVFQHYALFRHMSVFDNVAFGLRVRRGRERPDDAEISEKVHRLLRLVQLEGLAKRLPSQLSGGQRQRIALARALAVEPKILLLDEPFGALDAQVRQELRRWLRQLHDEIHFTSVFVTHDQEEAVEVADRLVVMNAGRVEQIGTPEEVFHQPASEFVLKFFGNVNVFQGSVQGGQAFFDSIAFEYPDYADSEARAARIFVRPHDMDIENVEAGCTGVLATIVRVNVAGPQARITATTEANEVVLVEVSHPVFRKLRVKSGDKVCLKPREVKVFW